MVAGGKHTYMDIFQLKDLDSEKRKAESKLNIHTGPQVTYTCGPNCQKVAKLGHLKVHSPLGLPSFSAKWTSVALAMSSALPILTLPRPQRHPPGPQVSSHQSPAAASWTAGTGCSARTARLPWGPGRRCSASWRCASRSGPPSSWSPPRLAVAGTRWGTRTAGQERCRAGAGREQVRCGLRVPGAGWLVDTLVFPPPAVFYHPALPPHLNSSREESLELWTWGHTNQLRGRTLGPSPWPRTPERPGTVTLERAGSGALVCEGQGQGAWGGAIAGIWDDVGWGLPPWDRSQLSRGFRPAQTCPCLQLRSPLNVMCSLPETVSKNLGSESTLVLAQSGTFTVANQLLNRAWASLPLDHGRNGHPILSPTFFLASIPPLQV